MTGHALAFSFGQCSRVEEEAFFGVQAQEEGIYDQQYDILGNSPWGRSPAQTNPS
jgi:hypothetical protein